MKLYFISNRLTAFVLIVVFINLFFLACMNGKQNVKSNYNDNEPNTVRMKLDKFYPDILTVSINTTVTWNNKDFWTHTVTSDSGLFDSKKVKAGGSFKYKFTERGVFYYYCKLHKNMTASVIVQ